MNNLSEFIRAEMKKRNMSGREFAKLCGIANGSISAYVKGEDIKPTLDTLEKLARTTGVDLITLIDLEFPGLVHVTYPPDVLLLARELANLRKSHRAIYDVVITLVRNQSGLNNGKK